LKHPPPHLPVDLAKSQEQRAGVGCIWGCRDII